MNEVKQKSDKINPHTYAIGVGVNRDVQRSRTGSRDIHRTSPTFSRGRTGRECCLRRC